jgi:hypothetical protein
MSTFVYVITATVSLFKMSTPHVLSSRVRLAFSRRKAINSLPELNQPSPVKQKMYPAFTG